MLSIKCYYQFRLFKKIPFPKDGIMQRKGEFRLGYSSVIVISLNRSELITLSEDYCNCYQFEQVQSYNNKQQIL